MSKRTDKIQKFTVSCELSEYDTESLRRYAFVSCNGGKIDNWDRFVAINTLQELVAAMDARPAARKKAKAPLDTRTK